MNLLETVNSWLIRLTMYTMNGLKNGRIILKSVGKITKNIIFLQIYKKLLKNNSINLEN